ncbi:hypothetical protein BegalDRAFT_3313 [Beggiatoa alba B18LD]|uniref:Uncharacterized protein n=1 Tax=Beggiatoa alba B18LD TaxID=395493 RepID=I3CKI9_9GAMM|nr:hypothetical protein [Beggiatoa alba]EIJ44132.1 hypothetical protein BegalDRAFT_3313 [Beggiatoa alba B18LD]
MNAIEFETVAENGVLKIPDEYQEWYNQSLKVILLTQTLKNTVKKSPSKEEIQAFFASKQLNLQGYKFDREEANAR